MLRRDPVRTRGFAQGTVCFVGRRPGALEGDASRRQVKNEGLRSYGAGTARASGNVTSDNARIPDVNAVVVVSADSSTLSRPSPQSRGQASSVEHPGPLPARTSRVAELLRDPP